MISIRPLASADIPAVVTLILSLDREPELAIDGPAIEAALRSLPPSVEMLIAWDDAGAALGLACYSIVGPTIDADMSLMLYLKELHVTASARRQGVAARLMARLAAIAQDRSCTRLGWNAVDENGPARALYEGLGATVANGLLAYRLRGDAFVALAAKDQD